jgi:hypothetical protein
LLVLLLVALLQLLPLGVVGVLLSQSLVIRFLLLLKVETSKRPLPSLLTTRSSFCQEQQ